MDRASDRNPCEGTLHKGGKRLLLKLRINKSNGLKLLVIASIMALVFFPWPSTGSYGEFSGFDAAHVYVKPDSNFLVKLDSDEINIKNLGAGVETIHLALSDIPFKAEFRITVVNHSFYPNPVTVGISYPLNLNHVNLAFSSADGFVYVEVYDLFGSLARREPLVQYLVDEQIHIATEISTIQSGNESIWISVANRTATATVALQSEVESLLRDQARLLSIDIYGACVLSPGYFFVEGEGFWDVRNFGAGLGNSTLTEHEGIYTIASGNYSQNYIEHVFASPKNWSTFDTMGLTINGSSTQGTLRVWLNTDWNNRAFYFIKDDFAGPRQVFIPLSRPDHEEGKPNFESVERIGIDFPNLAGMWSFDNIQIGKAQESEGGLEVGLSGFHLSILPHALAYAPLTTMSLLAAILLAVLIGSVLLLYREDVSAGLKSLWSKYRLRVDSHRLLLFVTAICAFAFYSVFFNIGDHAFDMFSQKLWSYDMAKFGLLSLYQRPAMTSAASMYGGQGTQHAIFAYSPLAGLYYLIIGKLYFLFSASPSVYDQFFTTAIKSSQTLMTILSGIVVFKLVRTYGGSWKTSFLTMLAFLLNPLILYDAAIWGHQDSLMIFLLFLALLAYETNHPKTAWSTLTLAVMVKSTAFAPATLMAFLLIKKFGLSKIVDGILSSLASGIAVVLPFVFSGASPAILVGSTVYRVFQFGTTALQYPRSAAVSPDGYNVWPLITYLTGSRSRDRMWVPDYAQDPIFGISYLVVGEVIFATVFLCLLYVAAKNRLDRPGSAALLLGVLMVSSTLFLTKTTARYLVFGIAYLTVSHKAIGGKVKWLVVGILTFTSVFAMHGLLVSYTGAWLNMYPAMSPSIPINNLVLSLYLSDVVITEMILRNLFAFALLFVVTVRELRRNRL